MARINFKRIVMKNILIGLLLVAAVAVATFYFFRKEEETNSLQQNRFAGTWMIDSIESKDLLTAMLFKKDSTTYAFKESGDTLFVNDISKPGITDTFRIVSSDSLLYRNASSLVILSSDSTSIKIFTADSTYVEYKRVN